MAYLLDTNAFIEPSKRWFGFDFCPAYWDWLDTAHAAGTVFSIERVADEIQAGDDELVDWSRAVTIQVVRRLEVGVASTGRC